MTKEQIEEYKRLKDRDTPKEPKEKGDYQVVYTNHGHLKIHKCYCPVCDRRLKDDNRMKFCPRCGQRIDWTIKY